MSNKRILGHFEQRVERFATKVAIYTDQKTIDLCWKVLPKRNYESVLDLAAGQGDFFSLLFSASPQKPEAVFLDISKAMLSKGVERKVIHASRAVVADAEAPFPFLDGAFDLVLCRFAWHDFKHKERVAREISRVLQKSGIFLFVDMSLSDEIDKRILKAYNTVHTLKTLAPTWITPFGQLKKLMMNNRLHLLRFEWYHSTVTLSEWREENQITDVQRKRIFHYVLKNKSVKHFVNKIDTQRQEICFSFPILIASFEKCGA